MIGQVVNSRHRSSWQLSGGSIAALFTKTVRSFIGLLMLAAILLGPAASQAQERSNGTFSPAVPPSDQSDMTIGYGDLIDLTVYHVPQLILKARVDSNGAVSLPLVGDVILRGLTVRDAQLLIARELIERQLVKNPEVTIFVEEFATQGIKVLGEVATPGIYHMMGPHKIYDAIAIAGGLTLKAGRTVTILHSGIADKEEIVDISAGGPAAKANVEIASGDTIVVSKAGVVYALGEVNKPGAFLMENNTSISLMKVIALAGSTTKVASLKHVIILRKATPGTVELEVSLDSIYHAKASDIQLQAEDVVFVPLSNLKNYGAMGIQGAIQAAVYTIYATELHN